MSNLRLNSGGTNEEGTKSVYCRMCGRVVKSLFCPDVCDKCGNMLVDQGYGISGDSLSNQSIEAGTVVRTGVIDITLATIDKRIW